MAAAALPNLTKSEVAEAKDNADLAASKSCPNDVSPDDPETSTGPSSSSGSAGQAASSAHVSAPPAQPSACASDLPGDMPEVKQPWRQKLEEFKDCPKSLADVLQLGKATVVPNCVINDSLVHLFVLFLARMYNTIHPCLETYINVHIIMITRIRSVIYRTCLWQMLLGD